MIIVEHLSKRFDAQASQDQQLGPVLLRKLGALLGRRQGERQYVDALVDVSFQLERGEILGVFGRNGSGKTTLLNVLSGVLRPDGGRITLEGRVASILDIGTGFHPDLSGRKNVFLNGRLRGMSDKEIAERLPEIHEFSGIGKFLDHPIKHYSNGMYLRLAFSIFAHLDTDIFLLDEVISVGDAEFRKKSRDKIKELAKGGATMIVVSHDLSELMQLCTDYLYLEGGRVVEHSRDLSVLRKYAETAIYNIEAKNLDAEFGQARVVWEDDENAPGMAPMRMTRVEIKPKSEQTKALFIDQDLELTLEFYRESSPDTIDMQFSIKDAFGTMVLSCSPNRNQQRFSETSSGIYTAKCTIPGNLMNVGIYSLNICGLKNESEVLFVTDDVLDFKLENRLDFGKNLRIFIENSPGSLCPAFSWELIHEPVE